MLFSHIYWVAESLSADGKSHLLGVYTSNQDLIAKCLDQAPTHLRLSLVRLDSAQEPLGTWTSPDFEGLRKDLRPFVEQGHFTLESTEDLLARLGSRYAPTPS